MRSLSDGFPTPAKMGLGRLPLTPPPLPSPSPPRTRPTTPPGEDDLNALYEEHSLTEATTFHPFKARADGFFYDVPAAEGKQMREKLSVEPEEGEVWLEGSEGEGSVEVETLQERQWLGSGRDWWESEIEGPPLLVFNLDDPLPEEALLSRLAGNQTTGLRFGGSFNLAPEPVGRVAGRTSCWGSTGGAVSSSVSPVWA